MRCCLQLITMSSVFNSHIVNGSDCEFFLQQRHREEKKVREARDGGKKGVDDGLGWVVVYSLTNCT
jgi:hypothetical protein